MWKKDKKSKPETTDATREALDFCFEDVSSLHMLGAAPLSDLTSRPGPAAPASAAGLAGQRRAAQRWNLVVLAVVLLTLGATAAAMLLGN